MSHIVKDFSLYLASINTFGQYMFNLLVVHPIMYSRLVFKCQKYQVKVVHIFYQLPPAETIKAVCLFPEALTCARESTLVALRSFFEYIVTP